MKGGELMDNNKDIKPEEYVEIEVPHVNRKLAIVMISVFMALLILPTLVWGVLTLVSDSAIEALNFDTGENRAMATLPEEFDPETFTADMEAWYNDNLPFRSVIYTAYKDSLEAFEAPYTQTIRPALIQLFYKDSGVQTPGGDFELDLFESEETQPQETETLPEFETEEIPSDCTHVLSSESVVLKEATCTEYGIIGYGCENCDYIKREYTHKAKHDYLSSVSDEEISELWCGTNFTEIMTCSACGDSYEKASSKKHVAGKLLKVVEPSVNDYGYTLIECADCKGQYRTEISNKLYDTTYFPPIYLSNTVLEGRQKWLFYRGNNSEKYYSGENLLSDAELSEYTNVFKELDELCAARGIELQISIWPNKEQVYTEYMATVDIKTEYKRVERLVDHLKENTNVNIIYPITELTATKPYYDTYLKYDTHWNCAGGFVGYQAMLKSLGLETMEIINCPVYEYTGVETENLDSYYRNVSGDMIGLGGVSTANYNGDHNYYINYRPETEVFTREGGNGAGDIRHTTSNAPNDLNFVLIGDSYRVMQLTYLERDFTDCLLMHRSHLNGIHNNQPMSEEDYAELKNGIKNADIIVISAVERLEGEILIAAKKLITILQEE